MLKASFFEIEITTTQFDQVGISEIEWCCSSFDAVIRISAGIAKETTVYIL
jgi:hypothetical protein